MSISSVAKRLTQNLVYGLFSLLPIKQSTVLLEGNKSYDDNTRALFEYMYYVQKLGTKYKFVWVVENPCSLSFLSELDGVTVIKYPDPFTLSDLQLIDRIIFAVISCTAKYCIYSNCNPARRTRSGQLRVYLMHGMALKNTVGLFGSAKDHDIVFATSEVSASWIIKSIPGISGKVVVTGYPRNDILFQHTIIHQSEKYITGSSQMKKIIWLPTFKHLKDSQRNDLANMRGCDMSMLTAEYMQQLNAELIRKNACLFIKFHPFQDLEYVDFYTLSNVVCLSNTDLERDGVGLYSLMKECDALITDYSSVAFDFMLLDKPIAYDLTDFDAYRDGIGFIVDNPLDYMPGYRIYRLNDFIAFIEQVSLGTDEYREARHRVCAKMNLYKDARACERIVSYLDM